ncbi:hypothetical protein [Rufibacter sp. LB8]|uniref:hypothetical protein n=1 Tax=Rufibacter sp. LB8 TaxID=2777781 RepID=UPI00178C73D5|nr:hypothetical protein [Rufibacter sp. LB8]
MKKSLLEWVVFGVSTALILALIAYLSVKTYHYQDTPPDLQVRLIPEQGKQDQNIYRVELENLGEQVAENVAVEVMLEQNGQELETTQTAFPMAPNGSVKQAWVTFRTTRAPGQSTKVHILGYNKP